LKIRQSWNEEFIYYTSTSLGFVKALDQGWKNMKILKVEVVANAMEIDV